MDICFWKLQSQQKLDMEREFETTLRGWCL
jgi:hypothetical protein